MNMQTDDWKCEHLIRAPKRDTSLPASPAIRPPSAADVESIRIGLQTLTVGEISRETGINENRIYTIIKQNGFKVQVRIDSYGNKVRNP